MTGWPIPRFVISWEFGNCWSTTTIHQPTARIFSPYKILSLIGCHNFVTISVTIWCVSQFLSSILSSKFKKKKPSFLFWTIITLCFLRQKHLQIWYFATLKLGFVWPLNLISGLTVTHIKNSRFYIARWAPTETALSLTVWEARLFCLLVCCLFCLFNILVCCLFVFFVFVLLSFLTYFCLFSRRAQQVRLRLRPPSHWGFGRPVEVDTLEDGPVLNISPTFFPLML